MSTHSTRTTTSCIVQHIPNAAAWEFLKANIPLLDCPDKDIEEIYYFRWWTFRKAIKQTPDGFIITEFLPPVGWAGKHNSINCAAGHHLREGRWLNEPQIPRRLFALLVPQRRRARGATVSGPRIRSGRATASPATTRLPRSLLPDLIANYEAWERSHRDRQRAVLANG